MTKRNKKKNTRTESKLINYELHACTTHTLKVYFCRELTLCIYQDTFNLNIPDSSQVNRLSQNDRVPNPEHSDTRSMWSSLS